MSMYKCTAGCGEYVRVIDQPSHMEQHNRTTTYISATHPNTGRRHTVDSPGYLAEFIAPNLAELGFTNISRTDSDGSVSLVKSYVGPGWHSLSADLDTIRDEHDIVRVEGAIRDAREDFRAQRITPERLSLLLYLGQCQPAVEYRIPAI